ncbi:MAG: ADP-forming succinate--CoA ligase subunit beta [Pseudomonadales bacterium]
MNLHEYQAKRLFADYGLPVSVGYAVDTPDEALAAAERIGGTAWVCKVQVHAGGRGKAGGVQLVDSTEQVRAFADRWLGTRLVTVQTDADGQPVNQIYVEACAGIEREMYLGAVIDRSSSRIVVMASKEGGVEIEKVAEESPEKIFRITIDPFVGAQSYQGRDLAFQLGMEGDQVNQFTKLFKNLLELFNKLDCTLIEINPLVITEAGDVHCLDAKINVDGNALYRQDGLRSMRDIAQEDAREVRADAFGLNYVALDGNIGCMVNGAGLAMGTMDLVKLHGGDPANFLDVGGGASREAVAEAFKIILSDANVRAVLINIFGGIVSCATISEGIVTAIEEIGVDVPVVVRFKGNSAEQGSERLESSGLNLIIANSLVDAAEKAIAAAGGSA